MARKNRSEKLCGQIGNGGCTMVGLKYFNHFEENRSINDPFFVGGGGAGVNINPLGIGVLSLI